MLSVKVDKIAPDFCLDLLMHKPNISHHKVYWDVGKTDLRCAREDSDIWIYC